MSFGARFVEGGLPIFEGNVEAVPDVGELVELVHEGADVGAQFRVLKREWRMTQYRGFQNNVYTSVNANITVERVIT